jgi:hypothetical protein
MGAARLIRRVAGMSAAELRTRVTTSVRREASRLAHRARPSAWDRRALAAALVPGTPALASAIAHLEAGRAEDAHRVLRRHVVGRPRRWPIAAGARDTIAAAITAHLPAAAADAVARADAIVAGHYDLLGYRGLRFDTAGPAGTIDWNRDPVHDRCAPQVFWTDVPFLDPRSGDHKIIWELNRHQHWLALGRGWWLTGDPRYPAAFGRELAGWMAANPPLTGINWASMLELALRSISWLWALQLFAAAPEDDGGLGPEPVGEFPWTVDLLLGLDRQLRQVEQNLSTYFSPNTHLIGEALALYVAGRSLPELERAPAWAMAGRRVLLDEMARQILPDGGHVERSFHYHRYALDFYLLALSVARLTRDDDRPFVEAVRRLARFARTVADDAGRLARIGDDDGGQLFPICGRDSADASDSLALAAWLLDDPGLAVGAIPEEVLWMTAGAAVAAAPVDPIAIPSASFGHSGYTICRSARGDHLVFDAGPHGFLNGGHAHADALAVALTVAGRPLFVDAGTGCYTIDRETRDRFRSTRLHNTVVVGGRSQSLPDGPFHWSHTAHGQRVRWAAARYFDYVEGTHDGYAPIRHHRTVFARPGCWIVRDCLAGDGTVEATVYWHLDPRWVVAHDRDGWLLATDGLGPPVWIAAVDGAFDAIAASAGPPDLGWVAPVYGCFVPTTTLRRSVAATAPVEIVTVIVESSTRPELERLPIRGQDEAVVPGSAVRLRSPLGVDTVVFGSRADRDSSIVSRTCAAADLETDAAFAWHHAPAAGGEAIAAIVDGRTLRINGRALVDVRQSAAVLEVP